MKKIIGTILLALCVLVMSTSLFTVFETEKAIVLQLGQIKADAAGTPKVFSPGLHWKVPFIDQVKMIDTRIQTLEVQSSRILTAEKKDMIVDLFVKWRVRDFRTFFTSTGGNKFKAERLLREQVIDGVRAEFGQRTVREVISGERQEIMIRLREDVSEAAKSMGMEVVDTRVKRIDFPTEVSEKVYDRMRTERFRIAEEHRATGRSKAEIIKAQADARVTVLLAKSRQKSEIMRGDGDAKAASIYANAYNQDKSFYRFVRSMQAYQDAFNQKDDILLLTPDGAFFEYFNHLSDK